MDNPSCEASKGTPVCEYCQISFTSKTKLFRHLEEVHGIEITSSLTKPVKIVLLVTLFIITIINR